MQKAECCQGFWYLSFRKACVCPLEDRHESARHLGQKNTFEEQDTAEIKNRLKAAWAAFHKYREQLTSKTPPMPQITLVQHGDHADIDQRKWNVDIVSDTRKNDQDRAAKDASPHRPDEKTIQNE